MNNDAASLAVSSTIGVNNMKKSIVLSTLVMSLNSFAGTLTCDGTVETVAYHGNNQLMVKLSSMNRPVIFCNPGENWVLSGEPNRVMSAETCKTLFSMFLSARATKEKLTTVTFDGPDVPSSCNGFGNYKKVFIRYVNY